MASKYIKYDLQEITDYFGFEDLCHDLMSANGYKNIEPLGGFQDKGRDAIHFNKIDKKTTIFCYSVREDYKNKLIEDAENIKKNNHNCNVICYLTNNNLSASKKDELKELIKIEYNWDLEIYDLNRLAVLIENHCTTLISLYPNIFIISSIIKKEEVYAQFNKKVYAEYLLGMYQKWQNKYTPLLVDYKEIDTYVVKDRNGIKDEGIIITQLPSKNAFSIILGESGSGKTTSLWKIIVDKCNNILENKREKIPILLNFRRWEQNNKCRDLIQDAFNLLDFHFNLIEDKLNKGSFLILIDGLNELPSDDLLKNNAYNDLRHFLYKYSNNNYIICCRTVDFNPQILNYEELSNKFPDCNIFEIRRITRNQIKEYIRNHLSKKNSENLIINLDLDNETTWKNKKSFLHLVKIPLYLQLIINYFKSNGELPSNFAKLLKSFINIIISRENTKNISQIDIFAKEKLLGKLAYDLLNHKYSLSIPENIVHSILQNSIIILKKDNFINNNLTYGKIWQEILSNNFLKISDWKHLEWIHPLIYNYFLAIKIVDILTDSKNNELYRLYNLIEKSLIQEDETIIALSLVDPMKGSNFLKEVLSKNKTFAQNVFINQEDVDKEKLSHYLITEELNKEGVDLEIIKEIVLGFPFYHIIENLFLNFKGNREEIQVFISKTISETIITYYELTLELKNNFNYWDFKEKIKNENLKNGIKRAIQILTTLNNNKNEFVRFYSAKGLWGVDRGSSAKTFKELYNSQSNVSSLVKKLMEDWNIS